MFIILQGDKNRFHPSNALKAYAFNKHLRRNDVVLDTFFEQRTTTIACKRIRK